MYQAIRQLSWGPTVPGLLFYAHLFGIMNHKSTVSTDIIRAWRWVLLKPCLHVPVTSVPDPYRKPNWFRSYPVTNGLSWSPNHSRSMPKLNHLRACVEHIRFLGFIGQRQSPCETLVLRPSWLPLCAHMRNHTFMCLIQLLYNNIQILG